MTEAPETEDEIAGLCIPADRRELARLESFLERFAADHGLDASRVCGMWVAVNEIVTNAIAHGYRGRPGSVEVALWCAGDCLVARVRDAAPPFDPTDVPRPDISLPPDRCPAGGMGLHMARQLVDEMAYRVTPEGHNEVVLVKRGVANSAKGEAKSAVD